MSKRQPTIVFDNLTIGYSYKKLKSPIITNISETLHSGELTCLLGANGVGKSTLLKTITNFTPSLEGNIHIKEKELSTYKTEELAKVISIVLTQRPHVYNMTVEELVESGRTPYTNFFGTLTQQDKTIIDNAINEIGIAPLRKRYIDTLSDGEKQKVLIAKALAQDTPIILLDEPTAFLDYPSKVEVLKLLHSLAHQKNKTILLSTHDMELAYQIADKIWLFSNEKRLITGAPEDLVRLGHINKFFENSDLYFENNTGVFKVNIPEINTVKLVGSGSNFILIKKALYRLGYALSSTADITIEIVNEEPFKLLLITKDGNQITYGSISTLLEGLTDIKS